jgi:hypothetical protein
MECPVVNPSLSKLGAASEQLQVGRPSTMSSGEIANVGLDLY